MKFTHAQYDRLVDETIDNIIKLGKLKGGEYAGDTDRLENFRRNGVQLGLPMEVIWAVYYNKHHDAIMTYIRDLSQNKTRERLETIPSRIDDMIVYLLLFKAMYAEWEDKGRRLCSQDQD